MSADVSPYPVDQMGVEGNLVFSRMGEHHGTRKRGDVAADVLQEYGGIEVLAEHNIDYTAFFEETTSSVQNYVSHFWQDIDAVWALWDEPAQAAINVLNASGLSDAKITGIDGYPQAIEEVCRPDSVMIATASLPFDEMGVQIGELIEAIVVEDQPRDEVIPSDTVYLDAPLVTKQNCQDFT